MKKSWYAPLLVGILFGAVPPAWAWGEGGHDTVTRVAARLLQDQTQNTAGAGWGQLVAGKENMLAHFSNVPDIVWRNQPELKDLNGPTHFVDLEYYVGAPIDLKKLLLKDLPLKPSQVTPSYFSRYRKDADASLPKTLPEFLKMAGSAPFRVGQLYHQMVKALREAVGGKTGADRKAFLETPVNQALLMGGLMSHFLGDLANPHHTTVDYDGWDRKQGGIHGYFEDKQVNAQSLALAQEVFERARQKKPLANLLQRHHLDTGRPLDPTLIAWVVVLDSYAALDPLFDLDRRVSLQQESAPQKSPQPAKRKPPAMVARHYHNFVVQRLALGADALAFLWQQGWREAGNPDVSDFHSYFYPVQPDFVPLDTL